MRTGGVFYTCRPLETPQAAGNWADNDLAKTTLNRFTMQRWQFPGEEMMRGTVNPVAMKTSLAWPKVA
jgi:hypothetical protein